MAVGCRGQGETDYFLQVIFYKGLVRHPWKFAFFRYSVPVPTPAAGNPGNLREIEGNAPPRTCGVCDDGTVERVYRWRRLGLVRRASRQPARAMVAILGCERVRAAIPPDVQQRAILLRTLAL